MRAISISEPCPPEALVVREVPTPEPGPGQVRIRVAWCGLNPLDTFIRAGQASWMVGSWPVTLGLEHSGVVDAVGDGVNPAMLGARVTGRGFGGYADYSVLPAALAVPLPAGIDLRTGAVYRGASHVGWRILHERAWLRPGDWVVAHSAAGPIGIMLTQLAKQAGYNVAGLVGSADKAEFAAQFGADLLIDTGAEPEWAKAVKSASGGRGAMLIVDGNGGELSKQNPAALAQSGMIVLIGATSGEQAPALPSGLLITHSIAVAGFNLSVAETIGRPYEEVDGEIAAAIVAGTLRVPITEARPLEETGQLHADLAARRIRGRAVIELSGER